MEGIPDVEFPTDVQVEVEDRVKNILTHFFLEISKIAEDESLSHMEGMMLVNSNVDGAKKGLTQAVDTALSTVYPVN